MKISLIKEESIIRLYMLLQNSKLKKSQLMGLKMNSKVLLIER